MTYIRVRRWFYFEIGVITEAVSTVKQCLSVQEEMIVCAHGSLSTRVVFGCVFSGQD